MVRFNYVGLPRSGKTSFRRRLAGEILNILKAIGNGETPSTGVAESGGQVIIGSRLDTSFGVIRSRVWSVFKNLKEEAGMLTQFIHRTVFSRSEANSACSTSSNETACEVSPESCSPTLEMGVEGDPFPASRPTSESARVASDQSTRADGVANFQEEMDKSSTADNDTIEDMFTLIGEAIKTKDWDKIKYILDDTIILTSTDTGGQAEFMDLHASLVHGPSFNLLFYRLVDELDSQFKVYYTDENSKSSAEHDSTFTVEEVLFQALSSIACCSGAFCDDDFSEKTDTTPPGHSKSTVMFVGTFRDGVDDKQFKLKDKILKEAIEHTAFYDKGIIKFAADGQLILPVDNLTGDQDEIDQIQERLVEVIEQCFQKISIPASWLVLSLHIRSKELRTMTLEECERMAGNVGISPKELKEALWFLHHHVGVLLYYPELEELKSTVICDIQVVFDSATKLIKNTFTFNQADEKVREDFRTKGQFTLMDVKQAISGHTDVLIPQEKLLKLLEHLNVLTKIPSTETYFMPCVLKSAKPEELTIPDLKDTDPAPLLLFYKCGYMPAGLFPALIANLISQERRDWEMVQEGLYKNRVEFHFGEYFDKVTLIAFPRYFKIAVSRHEDFQTPNCYSSLCASILDVIQSTLHTVTSRMNKFNTKCKFGFTCPLHIEENHLCEVPNPNVMLCLQNPKKKCLLPLIQKSYPHHKVWFSSGTNQSEGMFSCIY